MSDNGLVALDSRRDAPAAAGGFRTHSDEVRAGPPASSPFEGKKTLLRPITPADYEPLFQIELGDYLGPRWRQRGVTPSFDVFVNKLHAGVLCQYLVIRGAVGEKVGYVTIYDAHLGDGYAYFAGAKFAEEDQTGCVVEGAALLIDHVFHHWNVRKLYAVVAGYNMAQLGPGLVGLFEEEARLCEHEFWQGRYWDQVTLAIYRDRWMARRRTLQRVFGLPIRDAEDEGTRDAR